MLATLAMTPRRTSNVMRRLSTYTESITSQPSNSMLSKVAEADFPSEYGHFRIYGFERRELGMPEPEEAVVLKLGTVTGRPPLVRVHSECLTGDVFHSLRCDCRAQLELSLSRIGAEERGMLIYEKKEGRGIGLMNKLRAYQLQDQGADTVEANEQLGFESDLRSYDLPGAILQYFQLRAVRLLSNNPEKVDAVERAGVKVTERVPCIAHAVDSREGYLRTKKEKMGHL